MAEARDSWEEVARDAGCVEEPEPCRDGRPFYRGAPRVSWRGLDLCSGRDILDELRTIGQSPASFVWPPSFSVFVLPLVTIAEKQRPSIDRHSEAPQSCLTLELASPTSLAEVDR